MARQRKEEAPVEINLPITPMLDMSFQLLSFFILTFKPMPTEGQLAAALPKSDASNDPNVPLPPEQPAEKKDEYTIVVRSTQGDITSMVLQSEAAGEKDMPSMPALLDELKKVRASRPDPGNIVITVESAPDLIYARLIELMDLSRKAGFESVNLKLLSKDR